MNEDQGWNGVGWKSSLSITVSRGKKTAVCVVVFESGTTILEIIERVTKAGCTALPSIQCPHSQGAAAALSHPRLRHPHSRASRAVRSSVVPGAKLLRSALY